jgi:acetyl esterase
MKINLVDPKKLGGGQLEAKMQAYLQGIGAQRPPLWSLPIEELRADSSARNKEMMAPYPSTTYAAVRQITLPGPESELMARVYSPPGEGPFPLLVNFHGGGWVLGALDDFESANHILSTGASRVLLSVDYRMAPEACFPAAVEDCYAAYHWARENAALLNIDPDRTAIIGDSAGGNLAAAVALMCRDRRTPPPELQILIYPATDLSSSVWPSYKKYSQFGLSETDAFWFRDQYAPNKEDWRNPYLSPYHAADLSGLPPALVITAEFDVLRDEGEAYAQHLEEAGVKVACSRYLGMLHGFALMPGVYDEAQIALDEIIAALTGGIT